MLSPKSLVRRKPLDRSERKHFYESDVLQRELAPMALVLFRRRALGERCGTEQRIGRAFEKAVRREPLARRTRTYAN